MVDNGELNGSWKLRKMIVNGDTIFYRGQFNYTLRHNYKLNENWIANRTDSLTVLRRAEKGYQNLMSIKVKFLTDSTFSMTEVRGGGRIDSNKLDYGTYELHNDTLLMTNQSRRDYEMMFLVDIENKRFYQRGQLPNHKVFQEYFKVD